ncbi:chromosomal replication initiator protein DnaA [Suttonella ornithocola]|nr:chromosomal replication initiator protein DnaA [Suttonella ornithocola]
MLKYSAQLIQRFLVMNPTLRQTWKTVIDSLRPIINIDDATLLDSCELVEENGQYTIYVPNQFALKTLNEKLIGSIQLALDKKGIKNVQAKISNRDLFEYQERKKNNKEKPFESHLNVDYQFENFVVGQSNDNAYAAAKRVSEGQYSEGFNPLFIYGGTGLGKSHLMHAVGNALRANGHSRVLYLTAEEFTNDFINTIRNKRSMQEFSDYYRNVDALLIDDVQFLGDKDRSQAEFFHTFNSLFDRKRPIILTSDRYPKEIPDLEPRLQSRFGQGLTVSVVPPEFETRVAILHRKAETLNFYLPDEVAQFIAHNVVSNVRELEGALRKVYAMTQFKETTATQAIAREALKDLINAHNKQITLSNIRKVICSYYDIGQEDLDSASRKATVRLPRQVAMHLSRALTRHSTTEIGQNFGGRDHSTVLNACKRIDAMLEKDIEFSETYRNIKNMITG